MILPLWYLEAIIWHVQHPSQVQKNIPVFICFWHLLACLKVGCHSFPFFHYLEVRTDTADILC